MDDTRVTGNLYCFVQDLALANSKSPSFPFFFGGGKTVIFTGHGKLKADVCAQVDALVHGFAGYFHCELYAGASASSHDAMMGLESSLRARIKCVHQSGELL